MGKAGRWVALGTVLGVVAAWGGFGLASGASSSITTCTKKSNNKTKIITSAQVAKCTKKGKGTVTTWDNHGTTVSLTNQLGASQSQLADSQQETAVAERYHSLMFGSTACGGSTNSFEGMNLHDVYLPPCLAGVDLSYSYLYGAHLTGIALANANLSNTNMTWVFSDDAIFWSSDLTNANLSHANLYQAEFNNANLSNANLSNATLQLANLTGANVSGVTWNQTKCPDATYSNTNGTNPESCIGHGGGL